MEAAAERWTREDDKLFENALAAAAAALPPEESGDGGAWWEMISARVPGKRAAEVRRHYEVLLEDVKAIEAGRVPVPRYAGEEAAPSGSGSPSGKERHRRDSNGGGHGSADRNRGALENGGVVQGKSCPKAEQERRKGIPWTEEEHRFCSSISIFSMSSFIVSTNCIILNLLPNIIL